MTVVTRPDPGSTRRMPAWFITHTAPPATRRWCSPEAIAGLVEFPRGTVLATRLVAGSTWTRSLLVGEERRTQTLPSAAATRTAAGPTTIRATTRSVAGSTRTRMASPDGWERFRTQTASEAAA